MRRLRPRGGARRYDLAILGIGTNGHVGFNEPPSDASAPTRMVELSAESLRSNAAYWGNGERVPRRAVTIGMAGLVRSKTILLVASGPSKGDIVRRAVLGPVTPDVPASGLQTATDLRVVVDRTAWASREARDRRGRLGPARGRPPFRRRDVPLEAWPTLGRDVETDGLGVCAGTSFNTPAAANRLGLRVGYIAMVGNDRWSRIVRDEWEREGMPTDFLRVEDRAMPFVSIALNHAGDRGFVTYYGAEDRDDEELNRLALQVVGAASARHLHAYAGEDHGELVRTALERGMSVSLDAWGGPWWDSSAPLGRLLEGADVVLANGDEALAMTGEREVHRAAVRLGEHCPVAVVKLGADGPTAAAGGELHEARAEPADILDTTGAGDCFNAGFLRGWLAGLSVPDSLTIATICGARAVQRFGGYLGCPYEEELSALAAERGVAISPIHGGSP